MSPRIVLVVLLVFAVVGVASQRHFVHRLINREVDSHFPAQHFP